MTLGPDNIQSLTFYIQHYHWGNLKISTISHFINIRSWNEMQIQSLTAGGAHGTVEILCDPWTQGSFCLCCDTLLLSLSRKEEMRSEYLQQPYTFVYIRYAVCQSILNTKAIFFLLLFMSRLVYCHILIWTKTCQPIKDI